MFIYLFLSDLLLQALLRSIYTNLKGRRPRDQESDPEQLLQYPYCGQIARLFLADSIYQL